jgi:excisionase family DNA binding protein
VPLMTDRWMHRHEAADYIKVSVATLDRLVREGKIHKFTATGRRKLLFDREQLDTYVRSTRAS